MPFGGAYVLDHLWRRLRIDQIVGRVGQPKRGRRRDMTATERVLFALVANREVGMRRSAAMSAYVLPALPGRTHDLTAARTHKILRICERQGVPILAGMAYIGAGDWVTTAKRRPPNGELTLTERTVNRALSAARAPVERGVARLKPWRIFRRARCSPTRLSAIGAAVLTLERPL